jgi:hypothetical protein
LVADVPVVRGRWSGVSVPVRPASASLTAAPVGFFGSAHVSKLFKSELISGGSSMVLAEIS